MHPLALTVALMLHTWARTAPLEFNIRNLLETTGCGLAIGLASTWLNEYGESAFPVYEKILMDPTSKPLIVGRTLGIICNARGDRSRFAPLASRHLAHDDPGVRFQAAMLVERIGSANDGVMLVALLSDRDGAVAFTAVQALAAKGGPREFAAMEVWLKTADFENRIGLRDAAIKQRDAFKKRLDDARRVDGGSKRVPGTSRRVAASQGQFRQACRRHVDRPDREPFGDCSRGGSAFG